MRGASSIHSQKAPRIPHVYYPGALQSLPQSLTLPTQSTPRNRVSRCRASDFAAANLPKASKSFFKKKNNLRVALQT